MATISGINLLNPLLEEKADRLFTVTPFHKQDGLNEGGFIWHSVAVDNQNKVWWGQKTGLTQIDLNHFKVSDQEITVKLDQLEINNEFLNYRSLTSEEKPGITFDGVQPFRNYPLNLQLVHHQNHLTFHYSGNDWAAPHNIQYTYRLLGLNDNWSRLTQSTQADFRNIPWGSFTFQVRAIGQSNKWGPIFEYEFEVFPPWWRTWWAYCIYALILGGIIYQIYRFQLRRQFEKQETENLRKINAFKNEFYTNITHEFKTPLTIIKGMAEQVEGQEEVKSLLKRNSANLLNLMNQILDLRKMEIGKLKLDLIQGDIVLYLQYIIDSFKALAKFKDINLHFVPLEQELLMDFDKDKFWIIISNLLSNAVKFTPEYGKIYLRLKKEAFQTPSGKYHEAVMISIQDNGIGIPTDKQAFIFDRFYQIDHNFQKEEDELIAKSPIKGSSGGTGIGLALTKELISFMGGKIELESKVGEGSLFKVFLPIQNQAQPVKIEGISEDQMIISQLPLEDNKYELGQVNSVAQKPGYSPPRLLIIEDNIDVQQYLVSILKNEYQLYQAYDGEAGIEIALQHIPDLIISDIMMPKKDGFEVCSTLKEDERTSHIPIILLTAKSSADSRIKGLKRGADAYLAKPFNQQELFIRLEKLNELRKVLQQRYQGSALEMPSPVPNQIGLEQEDAFILKLKDIIEAHLDEVDFGIPELCDAIGISRSQLHLKIKALTNLTTSKFIRQIRLQEAKNLLETTKHPIKEIALKVGFSNPAYFTRVFNEEFGMSPNQYVGKRK